MQSHENWLDRAILTVESAIDALILEFLEMPFLHRVEHSLHARLFQILVTQRIFADSLRIGDTDYYTQPVHKEWPETIARPEKNGRRGNFDLAILSPKDLEGASLDDFRHGRGSIVPKVVIEIGLDYGIDHLNQDIFKLENSGIVAPYIVDLSRSNSHKTQIEDRICESKERVQCAYAHHSKAGLRRSKLIREAVTQPGRRVPECAFKNDRRQTLRVQGSNAP